MSCPWSGRPPRRADAGTGKQARAVKGEVGRVGPASAPGDRRTFAGVGGITVTSWTLLCAAQIAGERTSEVTW